MDTFSLLSLNTFGVPPEATREPLPAVRN